MADNNQQSGIGLDDPELLNQEPSLDGQGQDPNFSRNNLKPEVVTLGKSFFSGQLRIDNLVIDGQPITGSSAEIYKDSRIIVNGVGLDLLDEWEIERAGQKSLVFSKIVSQTSGEVILNITDAIGGSLQDGDHAGLGFYASKISPRARLLNFVLEYNGHETEEEHKKRKALEEEEQREKALATERGLGGVTQFVNAGLSPIGVVASALTPTLGAASAGAKTPTGQAATAKNPVFSNPGSSGQSQISDDADNASEENITAQETIGQTTSSANQNTTAQQTVQSSTNIQSTSQDITARQTISSGGTVQQKVSGSVEQQVSSTVSGSGGASGQVSSRTTATTGSGGSVSGSASVSGQATTENRTNVSGSVSGQAGSSQNISATGSDATTAQVNATEQQDVEQQNSQTEKQTSAPSSESQPTGGSVQSQKSESTESTTAKFSENKNLSSKVSVESSQTDSLTSKTQTQGSPSQSKDAEKPQPITVSKDLQTSEEVKTSSKIKAAGSKQQKQTPISPISSVVTPKKSQPVAKTSETKQSSSSEVANRLKKNDLVLRGKLEGFTPNQTISNNNIDGISEEVDLSIRRSSSVKGGPASEPGMSRPVGNLPNEKRDELRKSPGRTSPEKPVDSINQPAQKEAEAPEDSSIDNDSDVIESKEEPTEQPQDMPEDAAEAPLQRQLQNKPEIPPENPDVIPPAEPAAEEAAASSALPETAGAMEGAVEGAEVGGLAGAAVGAALSTKAGQEVAAKASSKLWYYAFGVSAATFFTGLDFMAGALGMDAYWIFGHRKNPKLFPLSSWQKAVTIFANILPPILIVLAFALIMVAGCNWPVPIRTSIGNNYNLTVIGAFIGDDCKYFDVSNLVSSNSSQSTTAPAANTQTTANTSGGTTVVPRGP